MSGGGATAGEIELRELASEADYEACFALQEEIWGDVRRENVPPRILFISRKVGGVAAGAFDGRGSLLGFVWGLTGPRAGRLAHWSHMLGVRPEARDRGLGRRLKLFQRERLLELGVETAFWTFDPLEARNAHFNVNRLGIRIEEYVEDFYGDGAASPVFRGLGTDRFVAGWHLTGERVRRALAGELPGRVGSFAELPVVGSRLDARGIPRPQVEEPGPSRAVRVEVPADVQRLKRESPAEGAAWRAATRRAFQACLARGMSVSAYYREPASGRCFYVLS
jgi:predicted GNAT superfamily acetyltransferase